MKRRSRELVVVVGQPRAMLLLFKQAMDRKWEMLLCLDSEKQHKGANVEGYINRRLVQWLVCGRSVALLMPCICISLCHTMQRHWYGEGTVGTAETTRWVPLICTNTRDNKCVWNLATGVLASIITIASLCLQCMCFSACYFPFPIFERKRSILCFIWLFS